MPPLLPAITQAAVGSQATALASLVASFVFTVRPRFFTRRIAVAAGSGAGRDHVAPPSVLRDTLEIPDVGLRKIPETATHRLPRQATDTRSSSSASPDTRDQASGSGAPGVERSTAPPSPTATHRPCPGHETSSSFGPRSTQLHGEGTPARCLASAPTGAAASMIAVRTAIQAPR